MALRGPRGPQAPKGARPGAALSPLAQSLLSAGIAKTPAEARVMARALAAGLKQGGFASAQKGDAGLGEQLSKFQAGNGLKTTGKLDAATINKLVDAGVLPESARGAQPKPEAGVKPDVSAKGGAEVGGKALPSLDGAARASKQMGGAPAPAKAPAAGGAAPGERTHVVAHKQTRARAELMKDGRPKDMQQLLSSLATLGFFGGGGGRDRLKNALRGLQANAGMPVTGKLDQATVNELVQRGVLPEGTQVPPDKASAGGSKGGGQARAGADTAQGQQAADGRGVAEGAGDAAAAHGQGGEGQGAGVGGQGGEGVPHHLLADGGRAQDGDPDGAEDDDANAPAGDDDLEDEKRGHTNRDDGSEDEASYWRVPSLTEQVAEALETIGRNDDERGAATYSWDVTFLRPGVYGAGQPAEPLWHVVVERAGAFDEVWGEAQRALETRIRETEPAGAPPTKDDFVRALRRARVRAPDEG